MAIFDILARARAGKVLTPAERALLKLLQGLGLSAVVAGLLAAGHALAADGPIDGRRLVLAVGVSSLVAVLNALAKYYTARGDAPLAVALSLVADQAEQRAGLNDIKIPLEAVAAGSLTPPPIPAADMAEGAAAPAQTASVPAETAVPAAA